MTTPNPACTINGNATPQDVSSGATVNGALASAAGAVYWSIACIGTDELNTVAAINATLTVNQGAKTFSFTAPATLGSAVIFQSVVGVQGLGLDANFQINPAFFTTFKVSVLTAQSLRVIAVNETFEQSIIAGWAAVINPAIRAILGGGGGGSTITLAANFTQPAVLGTVSATFSSTASMASGLGLFIAGGGYYLVSSVTDSTHAVIQNLGIAGNASPTSTVTSPALVIPVAPPTSNASQLPYRITSGTYTLDGTHQNVYGNTTSGVINVTMPLTANIPYDGWAVSFKDDNDKWSTNQLNVHANTSQQIQDQVLFTYGSAVVLNVMGAQQGWQWDATRSIWQAF